MQPRAAICLRVFSAEVPLRCLRFISDCHQRCLSRPARPPCLFLHPPAAPCPFLSPALPSGLAFSRPSPPPRLPRTAQSPARPVPGPPQAASSLFQRASAPCIAPLFFQATPIASRAGCWSIFSGTPLDPGVIALCAAPSSRGPDVEVPRGVQSALRFHPSQRCERDPAQHYHWYVYAHRRALLGTGRISWPSRWCTARSSQIDDANRAALVQAIIDDLALLSKGSSSSKQCRLTAKGVYCASSSEKSIKLSASSKTQAELSSQSRSLAKNRVDRSLLPLVPTFPPFFQYLIRSRTMPKHQMRPFGASPTPCSLSPMGGIRSYRRMSGVVRQWSTCSRCVHH